MESTLMPSLFVAHGSPMIAVEDTPYTQFLSGLADTMPKPRAIAVFSAHWEAAVQQVNGAEHHTPMYDFGGFPESLYRIRYTPPGDAPLAQHVRDLLENAGIAVGVEQTRGLDHGVWTILCRVFPAAEVPVIELSVSSRLTPLEQYRIGRALAPLRQEGVLVIGSGVTVHNFGLLHLAREDNDPLPWVTDFEAWLDAHITTWDLDALFDYAHRAPEAEKAVPPRAREHFVPLFYSAGVADATRQARLLYRDVPWGVMTNTVYRFD